MLSEPVLFEQDKRSDAAGIRSRVSERATAVVRISGNGSGNNVTQPGILATEDLCMAILLEHIKLTAGFACVVSA